MFQELHKNLGILKVGQETTINYPYQSEDIVFKIESPCDCSQVYPSKDNIKIVYKPKAIPKHLEAQGWYETTKTFNITFRPLDGSQTEYQEKISFTARIEK